MSEFFWLCGLLEGEGSFIAGSPSKPGKPKVCVQMTDRDVVERVARLFGGHKVQLKKAKNVKHKDSFYVALCGDKAAELMHAMQPHMSLRRQQQISKALDSWIPKFHIDNHTLETIVARAVSGESMQDLADEYGVSYSYVKRHKYASAAYKQQNASVA